MQVNANAPVFNRGMRYQTKEKGFIKLNLKFVGQAQLLYYDTDEWFQYCVCKSL